MVFFSCDLQAQPILQDDFERTESLLQLPFDPDDFNDTEFLRHLLLTHGLELQTDDDHTIGRHAYSALLNSRNRKNRALVPTVITVADRFTLFMQSFPTNEPDVSKHLTKASQSWRTIWFQTPQGQARLSDQAPLPSAGRLAGDPRSQLLNSLGNTPLSALSKRLTQAGFVLLESDGCESEIAVDTAVHDWLERGEFPDEKQIQIGRSPEFSVNDLIAGVSRHWRVLWVDCESGLDVTLIPQWDVDEQVRTPVKNLSDSSSALDLTQEPMPPAIDSSDALMELGSQTDQVAPGALTAWQAPREATHGSRLEVGNDVPAGFEALAGPQFVYVDLFFNGKQVGSTGIMATADEITFDDPMAVASMLNEMVVADELSQWLSAPLPSNGHLACFASDDPPRCGQLQGNPVAVIYNEMQLRLDLFVAQDFQSIQQREQLRHLPEPDRRNTAILSLYALASELDGEERNVDFASRALLGYGRGHVTAGADYSQQLGQTRLRDFKLTHYLNDFELTAGTYSFNSGSGLTDLQLIGAGFGTSYKTRVDLAHAFSSQLLIYLPTRSVVQLLINDRVYAGDSYAAGNQAIDTTALPDGTYEVEVRIVDPVGGTRSERRLFTKSTRIPPNGQAVIDIAAGLARDTDTESALPESSGIGVGALSYSRRLTDQSAYRLGILQFDRFSIAQSDYLYLGSKLTFQVQASAGQGGLLAGNLQAGLHYRGASFTVSGSHFSSDVDAAPDSVYAQFFVPDYSQLNLSFGRSFSSFSLGAGTSLRRESLTDEPTRSVRQHNVYVQKPLFRGRGTRGLLSARLQGNEDQQRVGVSLDVYFHHESWSTGVGASYTTLDNAAGFWQSDASVGWQHSTPQYGTFRTNAYVGRDDDRDNRGVRVDAEHAWFRASAAADISEDELGRTSRNSVATVSAHLGVDRRGAGMGGSDFAQAGVIVDVTGEPAGSSFDIVINDIQISVGEIGKRQFIGLQPFRTYEIKLVPHTLLGNGIADDVFRFTLFPGGVQRLDIEARREILMIATLVDEQGDFLSNAVATTSSNTLLVDQNGIIQAEVFEGEGISVKRNDGQMCLVLVPSDPVDEVLVPAEPLVCRLRE